MTELSLSPLKPESFRSEERRNEVVKVWEKRRMGTRRKQRTYVCMYWKELRVLLPELKCTDICTCIHIAFEKETLTSSAQVQGCYVIKWGESTAWSGGSVSASKQLSRSNTHIGRYSSSDPLSLSHRPLYRRLPLAQPLPQRHPFLPFLACTCSLSCAVCPDAPRLLPHWYSGPSLKLVMSGRVTVPLHVVLKIDLYPIGRLELWQKIRNLQILINPT